MMGNTNITGRIPCRLFEEHTLKTVMFSVNQLEGDLPDCVLQVRLSAPTSATKPPQNVTSACAGMCTYAVDSTGLAGTVGQHIAYSLEHRTSSQAQVVKKAAVHADTRSLTPASYQGCCLTVCANVSVAAGRLCMQHSSLEELYMSRLPLTGSLPDTIPEDSNLIVWYAINRDPITNKPAGPGFSGPLPKTLSNAKNLAFVELSGHQLTGGVPALPEKLRMFEVHNNQLDGGIQCE